MNILVVDDDVSIVNFYRRVALSLGYRDIAVAFSGEEALTTVLNCKFDLILLDIQMPGASGFEVISLIRNLCPHAVIAIISGHLPEASMPDVANCADLVLRKPIDLDCLAKIMEETHEMSQILDALRALSDISIPLFKAKIHIAAGGGERRP